MTDKTENTTEHTSATRATRNIILLSDGTGNSAAKAFKTNVWRLYKALKLTSGKQIACYDDGVGTSGFKPLQILGGAFGWGLSRNVRDLYAFLCRHYQPGDHIYLFGFSRGAFTARTLAGLILHCGVLDPNKKVHDTNIFTRRTRIHRIATDRGLRVATRLAYRSYRRRYPSKAQRAPIVLVSRWIRDIALGKNRSLKPDVFRSKFAHNEKTKIQCVGVWDTVGAIGMPIDEFSVVLDKFFYPHRFPDQQLSSDVIQGRHAVAIDDERHTFHPVLWNEKNDSPPERIKQVWFTGMHSDVGGGYPDDDLSHISLVWMIDEVQRSNGDQTGLDFEEETVKEIRHRATSTGPMHDSRRGVAVYYRYKPRQFDSLCNNPDRGVCITDPKIHVSVMERIASATDGYAPVGLPDHFNIINRDRSESEGRENPGEPKGRVELLDRAQSHIFWRRVLYFVLLFQTIALAVMPYYAPPIPGMEPQGTTQSLLAWVFDRLTAFLPSFADNWTDTWVQNPWRFIFLSLGLLAFLWLRRYIAANTQRLAEAAWWDRRQCAGTPPDVSKIGRFENFAKWLRSASVVNSFYRFWVKRILPTLFLLLLLYLALILTYRILVHYPEAHGGICGKAGAAAVTTTAVEVIDSGAGATAGKRDIVFSPKDHCLNAGLILHAGQSYTVDIKILEPWTDGTYAAGITGLDHFTDRFALPFMAGIPARRELAMPWFTLLAEIGQDSGHIFPMNQASFTFKPQQTGRLYLYVNDAINSFGLPIDIGAEAPSQAWNAFYLNNRGKANVTISWQR